MQTEHQSAAALVLSCAALLSGQHHSTALQTALAYPALADFARGLRAELVKEPALPALKEQGAQPLGALLSQGSARLQPLLGVAAARLAQGQPIEYLCFASACWLRYSMGFDGKGDTVDVEDALADVLMQNRLERWDHIDDMMAGYLAIEALFPATLSAQPAFADRLSYWLCVILANGMGTALQILAIECRDYSARDFSTFATYKGTPGMIKVDPIKVTVWNECRHEKEDADVQEVYPETIGGCIVDNLKPYGFDLTLSTLDDPQQGWPDALIESTEVAIWWGHRYHDELSDALIDKLQARVLAGMGLIVLHSGHHAKLFKRLMGTSCNLSWREAEGGERERVWCLKPSHPIAYNIPPYLELPQSEMYGEPFDIPEPDELIFNSWYQGGEVLRSGCTFQRGRGRIFFFAPGHETFPIYRNEHIMQILANAIAWAHQPHQSGWNLGNWGRPIPLEAGAPKQTYYKKPRKLMLAEKAEKAKK